MVQPEPWDISSHITPSWANEQNHLQYKELFDKKAGLKQFTDVLKYDFKSPYHGNRKF